MPAAESGAMLARKMIVGGKTCLHGIAAASLAAAVALSCGVARAEPATDPAKVPLPKPAPNCERAKFRVVLDVGHTADDTGAVSARGFGEYGFNLRLAKQVDKALIDAGFDKTVLLVTGGPGKRSLYARMARVNKMSADLLLSLHHDSVPDKFYEKWEFEGKPHIYNDRFKGYSIFISNRNPEYDASLNFGRMLGGKLRERGLQYTPHYTEAFMGRNRHTLLDAKAGVYQYDTLFVLKRSRMPAALLEAGSIVNRDEELALATPERQRLIGAAVVDAVDTFCAARSRAPTQVTQSAKSVPHPRSSRPRSKPKPKPKAEVATAPFLGWYLPSAYQAKQQ